MKTTIKYVRLQYDKKVRLLMKSLIKLHLWQTRREHYIIFMRFQLSSIKSVVLLDVGSSL